MIAVLHEESWVPVLLGWVVRPVAVTIGSHIFLRRRVLFDLEYREQVLRHEMCHVLQFAQMGLVRFGWRYASEWLRYRWALRGNPDAGNLAYQAISLEQEARFIEARATVLRTPWREVRR